MDLKENERIDDLEYIDDIATNKLFYDVLSSVNEKAMFLIPVLIILIIALVPIIIIGVGKTKKEEGIKLNWYDKILIEIAAAIAIFIGCIGACFTLSVSGMSTMASFILGISVMTVGFLIIYLACILFFETVVKRLKTHTFIKTTFIYWVYYKIKGFLSDIKITKTIYIIIFSTSFKGYEPYFLFLFVILYIALSKPTPIPPISHLLDAVGILSDNCGVFTLNFFPHSGQFELLQTYIGARPEPTSAKIADSKV